MTTGHDPELCPGGTHDTATGEWPEDLCRNCHRPYSDDGCDEDRMTIAEMQDVLLEVIGSLNDGHANYPVPELGRVLDALRALVADDALATDYEIEQREHDDHW